MSHDFQALKDAGLLPTPSGTALDILRVTNDPDSTVEEITELVESDPATAARLLKYVNSPFAGVQRQVASLRMAVTLVGRNTVKSLSLGYSLVRLEVSNCRGFDDESFWSESVARAAACRHIIGKSDRAKADEMFTCGLLCQIGRLAFATAYPETYAEILSGLDPSDATALSKIEFDAFEIEHNALGAEMMRDWNLPTDHCEAVRIQDNPQEWADRVDPEVFQNARVLELAGWAAALITPHPVERAVLSRFINGANRSGIKPDVVDPVFESIKDEWRQVSPVFGTRVMRVPTLAERFAQTREM